MGLGPIPAIRQALKTTGMKFSQMELLELNEAFAAQSLGVISGLVEEHDLTKEQILERCNVNGGAIALGHPLGATGAIRVATLISAMQRENIDYGMVTMCIGTGMGAAGIIKNIRN